MGIDAQALHVGFGEHRCCLPFTSLSNDVWRPESSAAQRSLEVANGRHGYGVDHLLVKLRVALRRHQPILGKQVGLVEINRRVEAVAGRVKVNHFEVFADRTRL